MLSIGDGDTIRVLEGGRRITLRLACIDAPEMAQAPYGEQARRDLQSRLRIGNNVRLIPQTVDSYGRTVAEVIGAVNLNLALVEDGQAFAYRKYLGECNAQDYLDCPASTPLAVSRQPSWPVGELDGPQVVAGDNLGAATVRRHRKLSHPEPETPVANGLF